jgi:hypothetical protein
VLLLENLSFKKRSDWHGATPRMEPQACHKCSAPSARNETQGPGARAPGPLGEKVQRMTHVTLGQRRPHPVVAFISFGKIEFRPTRCALEDHRLGIRIPTERTARRDIAICRRSPKAKGRYSRCRR